METQKFSDDEKLLRIVYLSRASKGLSPDDLRNILIVAREANLSNGITGILCNAFGNFLQVLEGPEGKVLTLYLSIIADQRHTDPVLLHAVPIKARMFGRWAMAALGEKDGIIINFDDLLQARYDALRDGETTQLLNRFLARVRAVDAN